jgi:hypothetical protein
MEEILFWSFGLFGLANGIFTTIAIVILKKNGYDNSFFVNTRLFRNFYDLAKKKKQYAGFFYILVFSAIIPLSLFLLFLILMFL